MSFLFVDNKQATCLKKNGKQTIVNLQFCTRRILCYSMLESGLMNYIIYLHILLSL